jgi:outer membrane protein assembly factor BamB
MIPLQRRHVLAGGSALSAMAMTAAAQETRVSTMKPFAKGDVFVGATLLNNPNDDHAGAGRIIQYDANLQERGVLWVTGTTHLVGGLSFAPDGTLWAFDNLGWFVLTVGRDGRQKWTKRLLDRAIGKVQFLANGHLLFTEYFRGDAQPQTLTTRYKTLPDHPGQVGVGQIYEFDADLKQVRTFTPDVHGGMSRSMAITHAVLGSDGKTLIYTSETGPRLMRFDVSVGMQMPDLKTLPPSQGGPPAMFLDVARTGSKVLLPLGNKLGVIDEQTGADLANFPLPGFGWAVVTPSHDGAFAYVANWFTGDIAKVSLADGAVSAQTKISPKCISGIAQFAG